MDACRTNGGMGGTVVAISKKKKKRGWKDRKGCAISWQSVRVRDVVCQGLEASVGESFGKSTVLF